MSLNHWFARLARRTPWRRSPTFVMRPRLMALEDRLAPATLDLLAGGSLVFAGANVANALTFSLAAGTYTFNDALDPITLGPGAIAAGYTTAGGGVTASGPAAGVNAIAINVGTAANTVLLGTFDAAVPALAVASAGIAGSTVAMNGPLNSTGAVSLAGFESITIGGAVTGAGNVTLRGDNVDLQQPLLAGGNRVTIAPATAGRAINLGGADSTTELGLTDAELDLVTAGNLAIGAPGSGTITVSNPISQGAGYTFLSLTTDGSIVTGGGGIAVDNLALVSGSGVALPTQTFNLSFANTAGGDVTITNTGALTLQPLPGFTASSNAGGAVAITTSGPMQVAENIDAAGSIALVTVDAPSAGQGLLINAAVTIHSGSGDVVLTAGDDLVLSPGSQVNAAAIALTIDFGNADPGVGAILSVSGNSLVGLSATLAGGPDNDTFNLTASPITPIAVGGGAGVNTLNFDAQGRAVTITPTTITAAGLQPVTYSSIAVITLSNAAGVTVQGSAGDDTFSLVRGAGGVQVALNGAPAITIGDMALSIDGLGGVNTLVFDFGGGSPIPAGGLTLANISSYVVAGTAGDDVVDLQRTGGVSQFRINGGAFLDLPGATAFRFDGLGGSDTLHVLYAGGDPVPAGGVTFDGGPGSDRLGVFGAGNTAVYRPSAVTPGDGTVAVDAGVITFANLTPVDITGMAVAAVIPPSADDVLAVDNGFDFTNGGATPALRVSGSSGGVAIETAALWSNTTVVIDTQAIDGDDTIAVNSATVGNNSNLTISTGAGADTVGVAAGPGISLAGQLIIASVAVNVSGPVTSTGAVGGITFTNAGTLAIGGIAISSQGPIVQNGTGLVAITGNASITTNTGAISIQSPVLFGAGVTASFVSTGNSAITFGSALDGGGSVTVTTGGLTTFAGAIGGTTALASLTANGGGTTAINGGLVRTIGVQQYSDNITVGAAATQFISVGNATIAFLGTLNGASAVALTSGGLIAFFGPIGGLIPLLALATGGGGTTDLNAGTVATAGDQSYNEPVILTTNTVLTGVNVSFVQTLNSDGTPRSLLVNASGVTTFGGVVGGTSPLASLTTNAPGSTRINGGFVVTTGSQTYGDAVTLSAGSAGATTTTLVANAAAPGGITFLSTLNGAALRNQSLQIIANAGDVNFVGAVGGGVELGTVVVSNARNVTVSAAFTAAQFLQTTGTGTTAFNGATTLSGLAAMDVTNRIITLSQPITAGTSGASVRFNATVGGVSQTAGSLLIGAGAPPAGRDGALFLNGAGAFSLDQPGNDMGFLAANVTGPVTVRDANDLTIVPGVGVHTNGGAITLTTGRNFTAIDTNFAVPLLDAGVGAIQVNPGQSAGATVTLNAEVRGSTVTLGTDVGAPLSNAQPDLFVIRPSRNIGITVKGNRPSPLLADPIPPGDRLQPIFAGINGRLVLTPTGLGQGFYTFPDDTVRTLTFFEIENLVGFSTSAYSVQTGPTSYGIRTVNQQLGQVIQGGIQGGQVPANPFVVAPAVVNPFGPFGAPRITFGDVNGDGTADLIIANGPNNPPLVTVINGTALLGVNNVSLSDPANILAQFFAYDPRFPGGVFVAAADFNGDGRAEIVTGPDVGGGPHVRVLQYVQAGDPGFVPGVTTIFNNVRDFASNVVSLPANFNAYDPNFHGGVRVAVGDVNGDGRPDIVTGAGPGGGPHVKVFSGANGSTIRSFFAYAANFVGGVYVAAGDYNQDGAADILTGAGAGGGPHVEVFSGAAATPTLLASFLAFMPNPHPPIIPDPTASTGVGSVAFTDANGDGQLDILVGTGRGPQDRALVFRGPGFTPLLSPQDELLISPNLHDGVNVAGNAP